MNPWYDAELNVENIIRLDEEKADPTFVRNVLDSLIHTPIIMRYAEEHIISNHQALASWLFHAWLGFPNSQQKGEQDEASGNDSIILTSGRKEGILRVYEALLKPGDVMITMNSLDTYIVEKIKSCGAVAVQLSIQNDKGWAQFESLLLTNPPAFVHIRVEDNQSAYAVKGSGGLVVESEFVRFIKLLHHRDIPILVEWERNEAPLFNEEERRTSLYNICQDSGFEKRIEIGSLAEHGLSLGWVRGEESWISHLGLLSNVQERRLKIRGPQLADPEVLLAPDFSWRKYASALNREYRSRQAEALAWLEDGGGVLATAFKHQPPGSGRYLWGTLPEGWDSAALLRAARIHGATFHVGAVDLASAAEPSRTLRLSVAAVSRERLQVGLARIAAAAAEFTARWDV
ncbi:2-aminoadipate transaminase [Paenibacillus shirakamiensis]|uniref:2-aminoadipate transaminase n=1 Tax=Paenibacillus shirakamiensis TaxID=1265935 RepID=A0ABS4JKH8_9BACL|nr:hypothetical protein [Paenibacillus shirakamiensis]MBP2002203.1 2-aminoadipate transaminase [Paenibacillus shirakamiensis]